MCEDGRRKQFWIAFIVSSAMISGGGVIAWSIRATRLNSDPSGVFKFSFQDEDKLVSYAGIGSFISTILTAGLVEAFGPCRLLHFLLLPASITWILMATLESQGTLIAGRIFSGFYLQLCTIITYPLLAEMLDKNVRGSYLCLPEIMFSLGHLLMNILARSLTWRNGTLITGVLILPVIGLFCFVPDSPYWYIHKGKYGDAVRSLKRLRSTGYDAESEMNSLKEILVENREKRDNLKDQILNLRDPENYRPTLLLCLLIILRELGGSLAHFLYAPFFFKVAGVNLSAFTITVLISSIKIFSSCLGFAVIDSIGRRNLFLASSIICSSTMFINGFVMQYPSPFFSWVPLVSIITFAAAFGIGIGLMPWILIGEILPTPVRYVSSTICCALYTLLYYLECDFLPIMIEDFSLARLITLFAFFNMVLSIAIWLFLPETKKRSLEDLQAAFVVAALRPFRNHGQGYVQPYGATLPEQNSKRLLC